MNHVVRALREPFEARRPDRDGGAAAAVGTNGH